MSVGDSGGANSLQNSGLAVLSSSKDRGVKKAKNDPMEETKEVQVTVAKAALDKPPLTLKRR